MVTCHAQALARLPPDFLLLWPVLLVQYYSALTSGDCEKTTTQDIATHNTTLRMAPFERTRALTPYAQKSESNRVNPCDLVLT